MNKKTILIVICLSLLLIHQIAFKGLYPSDLSLGTNYLAKEYCSCRYVMQMTDSFCTEYVKDKRLPATIKTNDTLRITTVNLFKVFHSQAKFFGPTKGCILNSEPYKVTI